MEKERYHFEEMSFLTGSRRNKQIGELYVIYELVLAGGNQPPQHRYVGCTNHSLKDRLQRHKYAAKNGKYPVNVFIRENGPENFYLKPLGSAYGKRKALILEGEWTRKIGAGLNVYEPDASIRISKLEQGRRARRRYFLKNRDKILLKQRETVACDLCNRSYGCNYLKKHKKTCH